MVFMIEKLLALAPKSTNRQLHFFVPFNFGVYSFLYMLQTLMKIQNTSTWIVEYGKLMRQANKYTSKLQKMQGKMSMSQFERLNKMSLELLQEAQKFDK